MLQLAHVLPLHLLRSGRRHKALSGLTLGRLRLAVGPIVIDDHAQSSPEFFQARHDLRLIQVVCHHADAGLRICDGLVEHLEDRTAGLEAHPGQGLLGLGVRRHERQAVIGLRRQESLDRPLGFVAIDERLRRNEAAREGDVELTRIGLAPELDRGLLRLAIAESVAVVHEHRRDPVEERPGELGVSREMHPAELLDRGQPRRQRLVVDAARHGAEREPVLEGEKRRSARLPVLDGEAHEILWGLAALPVHGQQSHAVAPVELEREQRRRILSTDLEFG